ncbi:serine hydrolase domain-containing protein [Poritiphilus flavus]|uniref:Serine hydrolase n=1 Tax=Poritiphilus flavus TaxID=2697053 RepID=A0A6L9E9S1_9FLAO|nr:serine hydrolase domain-containing protein [Poritiphilus flavus]NAS11288.1 serine hydrolase [Poritiphilus flavus]
MESNKTLLIYFSLSLMLISPLRSQMKETDKSDPAGVSTERLDRYANYLKSEIEAGKIPGAVSMISRNGEIVHQSVFGMSDLQSKAPMQQDNIFHIMSMTKPIVSVAFMMLYEEGHFFLTDPVSKYLPQFKDLKVSKDPEKGIEAGSLPAKSEVTIHQLLTHTAGFSHGLGGSKLDQETVKALYFEPQTSVESRVNTLVGLPMIGHPGEQWNYSASPDVLALLIEHFSGMTVAEFLEQRIFEPLDMKDTGYNIASEKQNRWVPVHNMNEAGKLVRSEQQLPVEGNTVFGGTHGLFSTAADYMKFCQMLLNGGKANGVQFLSPKTLQAMTMNQVGDLFQDPGQGFGLGFGVMTDVAESKRPGSVGTYYWSGAYCTYFFIDPHEDLIAIMMTQVQPYSGFYGNKLRQMVYQTLVEIED